MKPKAFLLTFDAQAWHVVRAARHAVDTCDIPRQPGDPAVPAQALAEQLHQWGYRGEGVCLGLPSDLVLAAEVDCTRTPRRARRSALLYRLEEQLPVDAEALTVDFLPAADGRALGLAVETHRVQALLDSLAEARIEVAAICPTALLALWEACRDRKALPDYVIVEAGPRLEVFRIASRRPAAWASAGRDPAELLLCLEADLLARRAPDRPPEALVVGQLDPQAATVVESGTSLKLLPGPDGSALAPAGRVARRVLAGQHAAWVDFRRDGLAPPGAWREVAGLLRLAASLAALLLLAAASAFYWRATRYEAIARQYEGLQTAEFRSLYPNASVPPNVRSRLRSELLRLAGISGAGQEVPSLPSALDTLRRVVASLPPSLRVRLLDLRVGPFDILLEGQARTHTDAEAVAQALNRAGFASDPPRTEALPEPGVGFTLTASAREPGAPSDARGKRP